MTAQAPFHRSIRRWGWLALVTAGAAYALIVLGGVVRITGSGMGCGPDWPLCNGRLIPPMELGPVLEWSHRTVAASVSVLVGVLAAAAWWPGRGARWRPYRRLSAAAAALLLVQVLLGAVTVWLELPPASVILHLGTAMAFLAVLVVAAARALSGRETRSSDLTTVRIGWLAAAFGLVVVLAGALVANLGAAPACQGFPLCNGRWLPEGGWRTHLHWGHRLVAYGLVVWSFFLPSWVARRRSGDPAARRSAAAVTLLVLVQVGVAAGLVLAGIPRWLQAVHLAVGTAVFVALVLMAFLVARPPAGRGAEGRSTAYARAGDRPVSDARADQPPPEERTARGAAARLADYVTLTKPRIISLLLLTTVVPMYVAGEPGPWLVAWTLVGGTLMAGGANAINMYLDRDIDGAMARTCTRPIPAGRMGPLHVLGFGISLGATAFAVLAWAANLVAAALAAAGLLFYVFVYTRWLKRSTPLNIVIGGAAGAFPPLVGWAAVTGDVSLTALFLFLIVFYWTPPHFWALALVKKADYAEAGVPMAPVAWGDRKTMRQMLGYTLVLLPLTLVPVLLGSFGVLYGLAALALGGRLLWMLVGLLRSRRKDDGRGRGAMVAQAMGLFRYSLLYLALLFGAMLADQAVHLPLHERPSSTVAERTTTLPGDTSVPMPDPTSPDPEAGGSTS